jgi:hypothetical protein
MTDQNKSSSRALLSRKIPKRVQLAVLGVSLVLAVGVAALRMRTPKPVDFVKAERHVFSQGGEDGVLEKLFEYIKPTSRFAIEFGGGDGVENSNIRNLLVNHGWSGLYIEGDEKLARKSQETYRNNPKVTSMHAWVYPGNVELLFEAAKVPMDVDLLVIDIDSSDWYVWRTIHDYRPKVVEIEYNGLFPPPIKAVVEYHPMSYWDGTMYLGASIQSYYELGKKKGYELVYADSRGLNLFFVDKQYYERFGIEDNSPAKLYRPFNHGHFIPKNELIGVYLDREGHPLPPNEKDLTWEKLTIKKRWILDRW